jgi:hypothetical protein
MMNTDRCKRVTFKETFIKGYGAYIQFTSYPNNNACLYKTRRLCLLKSQTTANKTGKKGQPKIKPGEIVKLRIKVRSVSEDLTLNVV